MASSKIVLFIVEGESDELALGRILSTLIAQFSGDGVKFGITRGDITSARASRNEPSSSSIKKRVQKVVRSFLEVDKLRWTDLSAIVLITDTDGAFIKDELVEFNADAARLRYFEDHIETSNVDGIHDRNQQKSACLKVLMATSFMTYANCKVPFKVAYMSRNLEHALSDYARDASTEKKIELARAFTRAYGAKPDAFLRLLDDLAPTGSYRDSWRYIARDDNSLKRGSNMKQVLDELGERVSQ